MYLIAFIIGMIGTTLLRHKKPVLAYALLVASWVIIITQNLLFDQNWYFAVGSFAMGTLLIAFIAYDNKHYPRT